MNYVILIRKIYFKKKGLTMINYKLVLAYDGSKYNGFQRQSKHPEKTIQGKIEAVLSRLFEEDIQIIGSGRTDAGVHSHGQTCNFFSERSIPLEEISDYLFNYLPKDIAVVNLAIASPRFHSRYNVVKKCYVYTLDNGKFADPFTLKYAYHVPEPLNLKAMEEASKHLLGKHDFKSFTSLKSKTKSTVRTIYAIDFAVSGSKVQITYEGDGFLQHMVRILTGTLVEVGLGLKSPDEIPAILAALERAKAGATAPSHGLCMEKVFYD